MEERLHTGRAILGIGILLLLLWGLAYTTGLVENLIREEMDPAVYGVASRYETWDNPVMPVFLWQGKVDGNPFSVPEGTSPTGDTHGNAGAFSLKQIKPQQEVDNVGWLHFIEEKLNNNYFREPVMTIKNKYGGKIRAVYQHSARRNEDDPADVQPALIWSMDTTRVPREFSYKKEGFVMGRYDVNADWTGVAECDGVMVLNVEGAFWFSGPGEYVYFNDLYPGGGDMDNVYRQERESELLLYAMDPEDEDRVIASAQLTITCYGPWLNGDGKERRQLTEEQIGVLRRLDIASHTGCLVRMDYYEEEILLEG